MPFQIVFIGSEDFAVRFKHRPIDQRQYVAEKIMFGSDSILFF